jgi:uncharacterized membrane protein
MNQRRKNQRGQKQPDNNLAYAKQNSDVINDNLIKDLAKEEIKSIVHAAAVEEQFSGPIPHPNILESYNRILPGAAERILSMAEEEQKHRQYLEKTALQNDKDEAKLGQICAFLIGVVAIVAGTYAAINGSATAGSVIGGGGVVGLVSVFILGRKKNN